MMSKHLRQYLHASLALAFLISLALVQSGLAAPPSRRRTPEPDEIRRGYNSHTGRLSFVGGDRGQPLLKMGEVGAQSAEAAGMTVIRRYAGQFGVQDPGRNLRLDRVQQEVTGSTLRYQQEYRGVPVVGGEMVVNTDEIDNVLSLNGEVSPDLAMPSVTPSISAEAARQIAMAGMQEWHEIAPENVRASDPELWIYDERIFHESDKPAALVWRLELSPVDSSKPVYEFVLVDARTGEIILHFNQVDTSWNFQEEEPTQTPTSDPMPTETPTPEMSPTEEPIPTETPTPEPTPSETPTPELTVEPDPLDLPQETPDESLDGAGLEAILVRYVASSGTDSGDCSTPLTACASLGYAVSLSTEGTTIYITGGSFTVSFLKITQNNLHISGGWNSAFDVQNNQTTIQGSTGITVKALDVKFSKLTIKNISNAVSVDSSRSLLIEDSLLTNNGYAIEGGGTITIKNSALSNNTGAAVKTSGAVTIINSTISGNQFGVLNSGSVSLINVTLANNKYGIQQSSSLPVTTLKNSLVVENLNTCLYSGQFQSEGYNLFDQPCYTLTMQSTDRLFTGAVITPLLNQTHHALLPGSPAINVIDSSIPGVYCPDTDQRGVARGSRCDTGAYEYTAPASPAKLFIYRGSDQGVGPMQMPHVPLAVYVLDNTGSPVPGVTVQFTAPSEGASGAMGAAASATFQTGTNGIASASTFRANTVPGSYAVIASVNGISETASFQLTNGTILYAVGDEGSTTSDCRSVSTACRFRTAVEKAVSGDVILVKSGDSYSNELSIRKNLYLSGGWNSSFTVQDSHSRFIEGKIRIENSYHLAIERVSMRGTQITIDAGGSFKMTNGSISDACTPITNAGKADFMNVTFGNNYCATLSYSISNNKYSGAIFNSGGTVSLTHVTMARNFNFNRDTLGVISVYGAGAIYNEKGFVRIKNSIVSNNRSNWFYDCRGVIQSLGNNIIGSSEGCTVDPAEGDLIGTLEKPVDPKLAGINSYESSPRVLSLLANSPAVDAADPSACPTIDQLGNSRPVGGGCDIGAIEGAITGKPAPYAITFTSNYASLYPGELQCMTGRNECTYGIEDADNAHIHAKGTVQFFIDQMGRNSLDNAGTSIVSTVQYAYFYDNAFWTNAGFQIVYGPGFSKADDVVAHEIVHGFTSLTSNLFYYYQSGAINESLSDLWGEYYDQINKKGNDSSDIRWAIGEDLSPVVSGPVRNMKNPPAYQDPDKITSIYYYSGPYDNGGVHYNSGVNNKAVYLMVDGGSFNNRTVRALGWKKTSAIYYYAQTRLLTSASDYKDLYFALDQACSALIGGAAAITADDCKQARAATDAVEMNLSPSANFNPDAPTCPNGTTKSSDIYFEDFENGLADWSTAANSGNPRWSMIPGKYDFIYATSGKYALFGNDLDEMKNEQDQTSDSFAVMKTGITIPTGTSTMLHFNHAYGFEWENKNNVNIHYDGGVLEYTIDDGVSWIDAKPLFSAGRNYAGSITELYYAGHNPLMGREAFVRDSRGYVSSRYNLASLAGQTVRFRWRMGTDLQMGNFGWAIDDVRIYRCSGTPGAPILTAPSNNSLITNYQPKLDWNDAANVHHYELAIATDVNFNNLYLSERNLTLSEYSIQSNLPANTQYYWRVRTVNDLDTASTWSTWSFRTALTPPAIEAPANGSTPESLRPFFSWTASPGADSYSLVISTFANFSTPLVDVTGTSITYTPTMDLPANVPIYWRVRANGANTSAWVSSSFNSPNPPSKPTLSSPANNAIVYSYAPTLKWNAAAVPVGAPALAYYHLQFDDDADFSSPVYDIPDLTERSFTIPDQLAANQKFYWKIKAVNEAGQYSSWATRSVRTAIVAPVLLSPAGEFAVDGLRPNFEWSSSPDATTYTLVVSTLSDFTSPMINITQAATSYTPVIDLPVGVRLYWRVRANGANPSAWTSSSFMIPVPPGKPTLSAPASNAIVYTYTPTLKWNAAAIPAGAPELAYYHLQFDDDADYSSLLYDQVGLTERSFTIPDELPSNKKFYWRVSAVNILGQYSAWSSRALRTAIHAPVLQSPAAEFVVESLRPTFAWTSSPGATSYTLVVSTYENFTLPLINITQAPLSYNPITDLPAGAKLYWRVRAEGTNPSAWIASSFMIPVPPGRPTLASPAANALVSHDAITLKWNASVIPAGAPALAFYQLQFDNDADYSSPIYDHTSPADRTFSLPAELPTNQKFYWRVRAVNILGQYSSWSSRALRTRIISPSIAVPELGSVQDSLRPIFQWSSSPHAVSYTILISTYSNFSLPLVNLTLSSTEYLPTTNLPPGTLIYWRVRANGTHPSLWSASSFTTPNPPKNPALSSPANNGLINTYIPTLKWNASVVPTGAPALAYYHIQVDNDADFSSPLYDQSTLLDRVFVIPNPLADNQKYYWRVRAVNTEGHYAAWSTRSFNTRIFAPILEEPAPPPATTESLRPTLRWSTAPYAVSYTLVVSSFADFSSPLVSVTIPDTSYVPAVNLPAASLIYWRVMANGKNPSLWTSSSFNTPNPPARPILSTPGNTVLISGYTPKLKWNPALVPVGAPPLAYYHVQVDDHEDFSSPLYDQSVSFATEFTIVDPLSENMKYYWRVRAVNSEEQFSWWSVRSFRTRIYPLTIETPEAGTVSESLRPTFRWSSSPHATGYALVVSTLPDFSSPLINITVTENSLLPAINLPSATAIYWRVMAKGSNPSVWTTASFTTPNPPLLPALQSPTGNIITYTIQPTLTWKPVTAPADAPAFASYHLQLDNDPDYSSPMYDVTGLTSTNFSIPDSLPADQRYFWRVRALNTEGQFHWWSSSSFRTVVPSPEFIAPDPEAVLSIQKPQFNWSDVAGATSYTIAVSLYADLSSPLINAKVTDSQYISTISLPKGKVIYWRVRAHGTMGSSQWTAIRTFKIQ